MADDSDDQSSGQDTEGSGQVWWSDDLRLSGRKYVP
jgi:hypothetical protein